MLFIRKRTKGFMATFSPILGELSYRTTALPKYSNIYALVRNSFTVSASCSTTIDNFAQFTLSSFMALCMSDITVLCRTTSSLRAWSWKPCLSTASWSSCESLSRVSFVSALSAFCLATSLAVLSHAAKLVSSRTIAPINVAHNSFVISHPAIVVDTGYETAQVERVALLCPCVQHETDGWSLELE